MKILYIVIGMLVMIAMCGSTFAACPKTTEKFDFSGKTFTKVTTVEQLNKISKQNDACFAKCACRTSFQANAAAYGRAVLERLGYVPDGSSMVKFKHSKTGKTINILSEKPMSNSGSGRDSHPWYFYFSKVPKVDDHLVLGFTSTNDTAPYFMAIVPHNASQKYMTVDPLKPGSWPKELKMSL